MGTVAVGEYERSLIGRYSASRSRLRSAPIDVQWNAAIADGPLVLGFVRETGTDAGFAKRERAVALALATANVAAKCVEILTEIAAKHGLEPDDILSERRGTPIMLARQEAMYLCAQRTTHTYVAIGRALNRDHSTVINGVRQHAERNNLPLPRGMTFGRVK